MRSRLVVSGIVCLGLATGCGVIPGLKSQEPAPSSQAEVASAAVPAPISVPAPSEADNLLAYFQRIRRLGAVDLGREHDSARQAYLSARTDFNRVRLAMLLSLPGTAVSDEPQALELLDPVVRKPDGQLRGLAALLAANLQERKRLDASAQGLQQKLDALRSLERSMIERKR